MPKKSTLEAVELAKFIAQKYTQWQHVGSCEIYSWRQTQMYVMTACWKYPKIHIGKPLMAYKIYLDIMFFGYTKIPRFWFLTVTATALGI